MPCEGCNRKFTMLRRRKTCEDCSHDFCVDCVTRDTGLDRKYQCYRCKVFTAMPLDRNAITCLRVKDLRWFLGIKAVPMFGCKEKTELVDLVMQYSSYNMAQSSYPQNYERHTTIPELLNYENEADRGNHLSESPVESSHNPGPSATEAVPSTSTAPSISENEDQQSDSTVINQQQNDIPPVTNVPSTSENEVQQSDPTVINQQPNIQPLTNYISLDAIQNVEHIRKLSVLQLKLVLTRNCVNYRGCCEKYELQERVRWLLKHKETTKNIDDIPYENLCKICMAAAIASVFLDCGHMVTCMQCGKVLNECPVCRRMIVRLVHTFKA